MAALAALAAATLSGCEPDQARAASASPDSAMVRDTARAVLPPRAPLTTDEAARYREIARAAWQYFNANYQPETGLVNAVPSFPYTTLWDVGGQLLAFVSARDLGLIDDATLKAKVGKTLSTLEHVQLFEDIAFNRFYSTKDASLAAKEGVGVSATDLGRLLVALHVVASRYPDLAGAARRVVSRNDFKQLVKDGYLQGYAVSEGKRWAFQEGRIGYEQYIATGFSSWGAAVSPALTVKSNAENATVLGVPVLADKRGNDRLLSEPFILYGVELGLSNELDDLAQRVLRAQEARFTQTGIVTVASEDAVAIKPYYFYYYCVLCNDKPFVIGVSSPRTVLDSPRWVSTKAAYGWDALYPSDYTKKAVDYVQPSFDAKRGWASGVFESNRASTETYEINTAAVLLEVAAYQLRGRVPLVDAAPSSAR